MNPAENFQHYQLLRREDGLLWELGRGSMGITYKAFDVNLQCEVALKVINKVFLDSEVARSRFIREARAAAALRHRNVASVYHLSSDGDQFFYAMEFIDGETVEAWVRRDGPLPVETALRVAIQVVRALGAAAKQKLVHRDIKPANLMVCREDDDDQFVIKLIDFGLARMLLGAEANHAPTSTFGGFVGTPIYASPEQLEEKVLDARSDIYSLGITLWFILAGRPPFTGTISEIFTQHLTQEPPWEQLAGMPEPVAALLAKMLQKRPARRPQSPAELRAELTACLRAVVLATPGAAALLEADDEDLSPMSASASGGGTDVGGAAPAVIPPTPTPGTLLSDRFRLTQLVGEGLSGQVWQAHDVQAGSRPVAVKIFHPELIITPDDHERLKENVARIEAAPHPHLVKILALDRHHYFTYLAVEWVDGFTLVDLLRKRGSLTVAECLQLLKQLAAATDHARAHGLTGLELDLHQILVGFPGGLPSCGDPAGDSAVLRAPLTEWPEFLIKIDALGAGREASTLATWAGEITLVSARQRWLRHDTQLGPNDAGESADGRWAGDAHTRALGALVHEFLSGNSLSAASAARSSGDDLIALDAEGGISDGPPLGFASSAPPPLPILGDAGNAVLRHCFEPPLSPADSADGRFASDTEFFTALALATGFNPDTLRPLGLTSFADPAAPRRARPGGDSRGAHPAAAGASTPVLGSSLVEDRLAAMGTDAGEPQRRLAYHLSGVWAALRHSAASAWSAIVAKIPPRLLQRRKLAWSLGLGSGLILLSALVWFSNANSRKPPEERPAAADLAPAERVPVAPPGSGNKAPAALAPRAPVPAAGPFAAEDQRLLTAEIARDGSSSNSGDWERAPEIPAARTAVPSSVLLPPGTPAMGQALIASLMDFGPNAEGLPPAAASPAPSAAAAGEASESPSAESSPAARKHSRRQVRHRARTPQPNFWQRMFGIKPKPKSR